MSLSIPRAGTGLVTLTPQLRPGLLALISGISGAYVRLALKTRDVRLRGGETLVEAFRAFQRNEIRLVLAFRHPHPDDGPVLFHAFTRQVRRVARKMKIRLPDVPHAHFVFSRDVPLWKGRSVQFLLPRIGATAVLAGRPDSKGYGMLRKLAVDGRFPIAMAPEGQVTYHNRKLGPLQPGTARVALWTLDDLRRNERTEGVWILPVATTYRYEVHRPGQVHRLLDYTEAACGIPRRAGAGSRDGLFPRILSMLEYLVARMERLYEMKYPQVLFSDRATEATLQARIFRICDAALRVAEAQFGLPGSGDYVQRVFAAREAGLRRVFRLTQEEGESISPLERDLADRIAAEAYLGLRHMELVDVLEYVRPDYVRPDSPLDRFVEMAENLWDVTSRLRGGNISGRLNALPRRVEVRVGSVVNAEDYHTKGGRGRRSATAALTECIGEHLACLAASDED